MNILIMMHIASEGPGTLGDFLAVNGSKLHTVRLYEGERLPSSPDGYAAIVSMGGPMNVYEEDRYPFLREETEFLTQALQRSIPMLGVCLGAQMIAKAAGAKVTRSPNEEIGWGKVTLTDAAADDPLLRGLPSQLDVLQWHGDMFEVPEGGFLTATGTECPHQAFTHGNAFGLQFHVEVTREMLVDWFGQSPEINGILDQYDLVKPDLEAQALTMYRNFIELAERTLDAEG